MVYKNDIAPTGKQLVLDAVSSPLTRLMYGHAIEEFFRWWEVEGRPAFTRATVQKYRRTPRIALSLARLHQPAAICTAQAGIQRVTLYPETSPGALRRPGVLAFSQQTAFGA
jgi:hypothetical protein